MVLDIMKAGGLVVAGTDTPNAINLHGELMAYTMAGMSDLRRAEDGDRQPGKSARLQRRHDRGRQARRPDRHRRRSARGYRQHAKVRRVIANGRVYEVHELVGAAARQRPGDGKGERFWVLGSGFEVRVRGSRFACRSGVPGDTRTPNPEPEA